MDFYTFFGPLFLLIVLVNKSSAIRCYSCSSFENPNCGDAFDFKYGKAYACTGSCKKTRGLSKNNDAEARILHVVVVVIVLTLVVVSS
ncbi:Hypothetical predicted protein [Octopus vulgaris]|uniref:Protein quiver n=1 Tax=Octopus vulgaris TaxID=6645 RepID=A0AA36FAC5_OCTVU|nr:Hypothetical predicted protein [Octopus vulgaris]